LQDLLFKIISNPSQRVSIFSIYTYIPNNKENKPFCSSVFYCPYFSSKLLPPLSERKRFVLVRSRFIVLALFPRDSDRPLSLSLQVGDLPTPPKPALRASSSNSIGFLPRTHACSCVQAPATALPATPHVLHAAQQQPAAAYLHASIGGQLQPT
jgi:hypothetical protein